MEKEKLPEKIETAIKQRSVLLFTAPSEEYHSKSLDIMRILSEKDMYGVYITINRPFRTLKKEFKEEGIDTSRIFFIDAISEEIGEKKEDEKNTLFLKSPQNLTDLSIVISEAVGTIPSDDIYLFFDSLSTLSVYNNSNVVSKFAHHLSNKLRKWDISGVFLSVEEEMDEKVLAGLSQFCDETVEM